MSKWPNHRHGMAISCLDVMKHLPHSNSRTYVLHEWQKKQLRNILHKHNSILTHADKVKMIIIVNNMSYQKFSSFLIANQCQFLFLPRDPNGIYQKQLVKFFSRQHSNSQTQNLLPTANYSHPTKTQSANQNP